MEHYLKIAEMKVANKPDTLKTILGSCVALCLWDKMQFKGGMVHIMMPQSTGSACNHEFKYADTAVKGLLKEMQGKGSIKDNLSAKIVGGASMFFKKNGNHNNRPLSIGDRNYQTVKNQLKQLKITIDQEDTGGTEGRRVIFDCSTGKITIRKIDRIVESNPGRT